MKKITLIKVVLTSLIFSFSTNGIGQTDEHSLSFEKSAEEKFKIEETRAALDYAGTENTVGMMNDLFGEENLYFPVNQESLNTVVYIVDLLIQNDQYDVTEKDRLIELANSAYAFYTKSVDFNGASALQE
ncbi:MAG: hypothetical protein ACI837_001516 [Crocinitomicaceae bacterium]|jgi:hypothetical protein